MLLSSLHPHSCNTPDEPVRQYPADVNSQWPVSWKADHGTNRAMERRGTGEVEWSGDKQASKPTNRQRNTQLTTQLNRSQTRLRLITCDSDQVNNIFQQAARSEAKQHKLQPNNRRKPKTPTSRKQTNSLHASSQRKSCCKAPFCLEPNINNVFA